MVTNWSCFLIQKETDVRKDEIQIRKDELKLREKIVENKLKENEYKIEVSREFLLEPAWISFEKFTVSIIKLIFFLT